jgi:hypothetical protein
VNEPALSAGLLASLVQVSTGQNGRVAGASGVYVEVLAFSGEQLLHRGILKRRGARPLPLGVGLELREGPLDLLCSASPVPPCSSCPSSWWVAPSSSSSPSAQVPRWRWARYIVLGLGRALRLNSVSLQQSGRWTQARPRPEAFRVEQCQPMLD